MISRIRALQQTIKHPVLIENPVDLLYLTGLSLSRGVYIIDQEESCLFVDGRYLAKAEKEASTQVHFLKNDAILDWLKARNIHSLEFDSAFTSYDQFETWKKNLHGITLHPKSNFLKWQRAIKEEKEIQALRRAAQITFLGFRYIESLLKEGITEEELALEFEIFVRKKGASRLSFEPIIAFGENSAYPHYRAGKEKLRRNQVVLIDVGAVVEQYSGDLTRVVFFGEKNPQIHQWLLWTQEAQKKAIALAKPGVKCKELDLAVREVYAKHGVEELFVHALGHGIGLETHEFPSVKKMGPDVDVELKEGMVFTIEPGLYQPGLGGVRWEDVVFITKDGCMILYG